MNNEPEQTTDYTKFDDDTLQEMFDAAETDSPEYNEILKELSNRGFSFTTEDEEEIEEPETLALPQPSGLSYTQYGNLGSRVWNIAGAVLALTGGWFFIHQLSQFGKVETRLYILVGAVAAIIISLSFIVSGIRHLANRKNPFTAFSKYGFIEYAILAVLWFGATCFGLYSGIMSFLHYKQLGIGIASYIALPAMVMMIFGFGMAAIFFYLAKELKD